MLESAAVDRLFGSWSTNRGDPDAIYTESGDITGARGEWLYDNDPIAHALVEAILSGSIGADGLKHRSIYQADDDAEVNAAELSFRRHVERRIASGTKDKRFDAGGILTRANMSRVTLTTTILNGDVWSTRCWKPNRHNITHATCWRIVHPARICNPNDASDTIEIRQGVRRDSDGVPVSIFVRSQHPAAQYMGQSRPTWSEVPIWSPDGQLNVTHHCLPRHADQLRPAGWFAPVVQIMRLFGQTLKAKAVADTIKASMGLICECDDPKAAARMDRNGAVLEGNTKIVPGKTYYVKKGTVWKPLDFNYQGQDFSNWFEVVLTNICAPFQVPYEFVVQRLTKTNLAASRVALMQAYRTFHCYQNDLIATTEMPWDQSLILEDLARGTFGIGLSSDTEALDRLLDSAYLRPSRPMPDPLKEAQAFDVWVKRLGRSLSGIYADAGMDFGDEIAQREHDDEDLAKRGIVLQGDGQGTPPAPPASDASAPGQAEPVYGDTMPEVDETGDATNQSGKDQSANGKPQANAEDTIAASSDTVINITPGPRPSHYRIERDGDGRAVGIAVEAAP